MTVCNARKLTDRRVAVGLGLIGVVTFVAAIDRDRVFTSLGVVLVISGLFLYGVDRVLAEVRSVNRPADDAFVEGYESGYDRGWRDGNSTARPTLITLAGVSASPEFADSCDVQPQPPANRAANR